MTDWATSTAEVVLQSIMAQLRANSNLSGVQLLDQDIGQPESENIVLTGNVKWEEDEWVDIGAQRRQETYTLDAFVSVRYVEGPKGGVPECRKRCFFLAGEVERTVRDSIQQAAPQYSGPLSAAFGQNAAQVTNIGVVPVRGIGGAVGKTGHFYQLDLGVRVVARK